MTIADDLAEDYGLGEVYDWKRKAIAAHHVGEKARAELTEALAVVVELRASLVESVAVVEGLQADVARLRVALSAARGHVAALRTTMEAIRIGLDSADEDFQAKIFGMLTDSLAVNGGAT